VGGVVRGHVETAVGVLRARIGLSLLYMLIEPAIIPSVLSPAP
jgi:hypothetical protein